MVNVPLDYFSVNDGNILPLVERFRQLVLEGIWPVILVDDAENVVAECNDEQELRESLRRALRGLRVRLSCFCEQDGNTMSVEERIQQLVSLDIWHIILTAEDGRCLEICNNEQELRDSLIRREILQSL